MSPRHKIIVSQIVLRHILTKLREVWSLDAISSQRYVKPDHFTPLSHKITLNHINLRNFLTKLP
jgi:hypothetical protein